MLDGMDDPFTCLSEDGRILYLNRRAAELLGAVRDDIIGRSMWDFLPPDIVERFRATIRHVLATGETARVENIGPRTQRYYETMFTPVAGGVSLLSRDIHEQHLLARRLSDQEERLRVALEASAIGTWDYDLVQRRITVSPRLYEIFGRDEAAFRCPPDQLLELLHPEDRASIRRVVEAAFPGRLFRFECRTIRPNGELRWLAASGRVQCDATGRPARIIGTLMDETESRRAHRELRTMIERFQLSQQRLSAVLNSVGDHLASFDHQWRYTFISEQGAALLGKPVHELLGRSIWEMFPEAVGNQFYRECHEAVATQRTFSSVHYYAPWKKWLENHFYPTADGLTVFSADVTARRAAEQALAKSEAEFRSLFQLAAVGAGQAELPSCRLVRVNARYCAISGYSEEELLTMTLVELTHPEDRAADAARRQHAIDSGEDQWESEKRFVRKDGSVAWVVVSARVLRDADGRPANIFGHVLDITERKATEAALEAAQDELQRHATQLEATVAERTRELLEKVGELETFSYSASHDLRAPLRALAGYAQLLHDDYGPKLDDTARHYLDRLVKSAARLDLLVQDMLAYSRLAQERLVLTPVSLEEIVRDVIEQYGVGSAASAELDVRSPLPHVLAHPAAISQSVVNLLSNAVKFVRPGEMPRIEIWAERVGGDRVRLFVRDHGIGIAARYHRQIFRLFERVHTSGFEGTGIGLAIVEKAMRRMHGATGVESQEGHGATFWLELPAA